MWFIRTVSQTSFRGYVEYQQWGCFLGFFLIWFEEGGRYTPITSEGSGAVVPIFLTVFWKNGISKHAYSASAEGREGHDLLTLLGERT